MTRYYVVEVDAPGGSILVGPWYTSKRSAAGWVSFVKRFYNGAPTRVRGFTEDEAKAIQQNGGQLKREAGE